MMGYVARQYRWYKLEFGLTMLSWWEVTIFSTFSRFSGLSGRIRSRVVLTFAALFTPFFRTFPDCFLLVVLSVTGYYLYSLGSSVAGLLKSE